MTSFTATSPSSSSYFRRNIHFSGDVLSSTASLFSDLRLFPPRCSQQSFGCKSVKRFSVLSAAVKAKEPSLASDSVLREPHKYFDQVIITVRSGDGGHGTVLKMPNEKTASKSDGKPGKGKTGKSRKRGSFKRDSDGSLVLPLGGHGGDVIIYADESIDTLLEFHKKSRYNAKRGGSVGSMGVLTPQLRDGFAAPTLRIPVPVGTVVKRKRGKLLADLANPGQEVLVARGGPGGMSLLEIPEHRRGKMMGLPTSVMRDESDKVLALGQPGEEVSLELILRVVADVGLVGLPNAGKSTLLSAITLAKPEIADYPFTTLMPNLGRLDGDPTLGAGMYSSEATLADLPGLIEGAHLGKGLGRNFLRHLRRTRFLVHVVDAAAEDPVKDYRTVKEELRMYNPDYLERPFIVALNKVDLPQARDRLPYLIEAIRSIGTDSVSEPLEARCEDPGSILPTLVQQGDMHPSVSEGNKTDEETKDKRDKVIEEYPRPLSVIGVSVLKGVQVTEMLGEIRKGLRKCRDGNQQLPLQK